ncbi:hypothetical protein BTVI_10407 [Pitangus sulphuratus]|nr:hypothetical protein BTVI_10407 [Pitangus sulphuratus]
MESEPADVTGSARPISAAARGYLRVPAISELQVLLALEMVFESEVTLQMGSLMSMILFLAINVFPVCSTAKAIVAIVKVHEKCVCVVCAYIYEMVGYEHQLKVSYLPIFILEKHSPEDSTQTFSPTPKTIDVHTFLWASYLHSFTMHLPLKKEGLGLHSETVEVLQDDICKVEDLLKNKDQ